MKLPINSLRKKERMELPLIPMRELIIFPHMVSPFFVGRDISKKAIEEAMAADRKILLVPQKSGSDHPDAEDVHKIGVQAHIMQILKLPDGSIRVLAEAKQRVTLKKSFEKKGIFRAQVETLDLAPSVTQEMASRMQAVHNSFQKYLKTGKKVSRNNIDAIKKAETPDKLVDLITGAVDFKLDKKLDLLLEIDTAKRLENLAITLEVENEVKALQNDIDQRVKKRIEQTQKEYFLNEQMKEIQKELGNGDSDPSGSKELLAEIEAKNLPEEVKEKALKEAKRLGRLQPMAPEAGILRTYLEWIVDLPWTEISAENKDIIKAEKILNADHYDMQKAKERILDFIAVRQLKETTKGPILCLVGPPGTGKTSLGRSIARSLGREFIRISLGGVRDEAEIRGHRKTYIGALPGKIIQSMKKAATINPVFLLDEIDKMSSDFRGDPAAALLEVLDPEQNATFMDHYLEVNYDLSKVMFVTTANSLHPIPRPLLDRMEIIQIPGYTEFEKAEIAKQFIIQKQQKENGLDKGILSFDDEAIRYIIQHYTMESGVRNLERRISQVMRKIARKALEEGTQILQEERIKSSYEYHTYPTPFKYPFNLGGFRYHVQIKDVIEFLGPPPKRSEVKQELRPGLAYGLAWTEVGGTVLPVEVSLLKGKGNLILTGSLGDVMKESAQIALSFLRSHGEALGIDPDFYEKNDIHIHFPEGAIPKDGPSAGITMTCALTSALTGKNVKKDIAMTGEVTLTDRLLPIGGVKEKVLAAHRNHFTEVLLPQENEQDLDELPMEVRRGMTFQFTDSVQEALKILFSESS
ncbi:endopeptidase La [Spirochaeta cellobiosiphila]|uniref:endopeptidase La n=1 Tax=Spirochaeta cellobiosiphila TaxID=504483 RepID=UPI0004194A10|nr:endopeptidase La [Spirochaeta cellobiosiphila]